MDLISDHPFWTVRNGLLVNFPPLLEDTTCDIAVLGAGITGALLAEALSADGHQVVVLDARDVGHGSTSASTALLQYEVDTHLIDLIQLRGKEHARLAYLACHESIDILEQRISDLQLDCGFTRKDSLYLASKQKHVKTLRQEAQARRDIGINALDWTESDVSAHLGFKRPAAILSSQAAEVDAYRLTTGLLQVAASRGAKIFDRTKVTRLDVERDGVRIRTSRNASVRARRVIVATGYESQLLFDTASSVSLRSSFAIASEPLAPSQHWWHRCLIWESARPYFYLRTDEDGRAIMGGEDVAFRNPLLRDKLIPAKSRKLEKRFREMFPHIPMEISYAWAGTFGETKDGLAYIGPHKKHPLCLFALGYGGNGITYSVIAAEILRREVIGQRHLYSDVFRFSRD